MLLKNVKRIVSLFVVFAMTLSLMPIVFSASAMNFTDFPTGWSSEAMTAAVNNGLLNGRSATEIAPEGELTRAEMATIINRSFGATVEANITSYHDVASTAWYYHEIAKAVNMQTLEGDSASEMRPDDAITREEVFTVIARAIVLESQDFSSLAKFDDGNNVSDWAKKYISALVSYGYVNGDSAGNLTPKANITREEFAQVMHNIIKTYYTEKGTFTTAGQNSSLIRTTDVNLKDVTIDGDLIIGDGVGYGSVTLTNVTIKGRLLCRGGEKAIKLINSTVKDKVVVKDINGVVHFNNYRYEKVFDNILMLTKATFLIRSFGSSSSGGGPVSKTYYNVEFYDGMVEDAEPIASKNIEKDNALNSLGEDVTVASIYKQNGVDLKSGTPYKWVGKGIYEGTYTHTVAPEFIYYNTKDGANRWEVFTEDVILDAATVGADKDPEDKTLEVYYAYKNAAVLLKNLVPSFSTVAVGVDYNSKSRLADSMKVLMFNAKDELMKGESEIDAKQKELYKLLGDKTGIITNDGFIEAKPFSLRIADVIPYSQIVGMVKSYVHGVLEEGTDEEISQIFGFMDNNTLASYIISLLKDDTIVDSILANPEAKQSFVDSLTSDDKFISDMLDNAGMRDRAKDAIGSTETKQLVSDMLNDPTNGETIKSEIINVVKKDDTFGTLVTSITSDIAFKEDIIAQVYKDDPEFNQEMYNAAKPVIIKELKESDAYKAYADNITDGVFDDIIEFYFTESWDETAHGFNLDHTELVSFINTTIDDMADDYVDYSKTPVVEKPNGYDLMDDVFTSTVDEYIDKYLNDGFDPTDEKDKKDMDMIEESVIIFTQAYLRGEVTAFDGNAELTKTIDDTIKSITDGLVNGMTNDDIKAVTDKFVESETEAKDTLLSILNKDKDSIIQMVIEYIKGIRGDATKMVELEKQAMDMLNGYKPYTDLMDSFGNKKATFPINASNVAFVNVIRDKINSFEYAEIKKLLISSGYSGLINLLGTDKDGKDVFESVFTESRNNYIAGLDTEIAKVQADSTVATQYTTSLSVNIDIVSILKNIYSEITTAIKDQFAGKEIYCYDKNEALKKYANIDWFSVIIGQAPDGRYYIKDFFAQYDAIVDTMILMDEALCWYGNPANYADSNYKEVKKELADDMISWIDTIITISGQITSGQPIGGKYTIDELIAKVGDINNIANSLGESSLSSYGDTIKSLVDTLTNVLTKLGEGEIAGGYTLSEVNRLCEKLKNAVGKLGNEEYQAIDAELSGMVNKALDKIDAMLNELDKDGTIRGKSIEAIMSRFSILNNLYNQYGTRLKKLVSAMANANIGDTDIEVDSEWMTDIIFGADDYKTFTIDNLFDIAPSKLKTIANKYSSSGEYIFDFYNVTVGSGADEASFKVERRMR